ncbi:MAG: KpsF/GutQ family sugar-phosphate isomerase [Bacteroidota bacterium]|nr:KpsF/GutQ family sugar-phosphate isomerase [Bacteroidota bacterium]
MKNGETIATGRRVIRIEMEALSALIERIGPAFAEAVDCIYESSGRLVVTGVGKSGLIARKIVATMNSTGTPALFLHPVDALHGDVGMVRPEDVALILSKSGNTEEIKNVVPVFQRIGVRIIAIAGKTDSFLARVSDIVLDGSVAEEACPLDLAPTASTTVALALGDALAIALLEKRGFTAEHFALYHPAGSLGKRLLLQVNRIMSTGQNVPVVNRKVALTEAIIEMTSKRLGATCVVDDDGTLLGIITDGDLRRLLERQPDISSLLAADAMTANPKTIYPNALASQALELMEQFKITQLIIIDGHRKPVGIVHLHDLIQLGLR